MEPLRNINYLSSGELTNEFERFRPLLNRYQRKYYFVDYDKEDIEQEAWIAFVESYRSFNHCLNISFASYYSKVLRNHLNSIIRYQNAYKRTSNIDKISWDKVQEESADYDMIYINNQTPVDTVISNEVLKELLLKLSQLEFVVFKKMQEGKDNKQIAVELGMSVKKIKNARDRIIKKKNQLLVQY